jgi:creatinine deaminase
MLVLARQKDQSIVIGDDVVVTVVDIRGDKVRLGIAAPRDVSVHRQEIYNLVKKNQGAAVGLEPSGESKAASNGNAASHIGNGADPFMKAAIEEARLGMSEGGLPIGSVLVRGGAIIGRGHNRRVQKNDPMAHAEIDCLSNAGRQKTYKDTVLYSTLMPCNLCSGAVVQFGIPRVIVGESKNFGGAPELLKKHGVEFTDLHDPECTAMMSVFIAAHPELWTEDIGK